MRGTRLSVTMSPSDPGGVHAIMEDVVSPPPSLVNAVVHHHDHRRTEDDGICLGLYNRLVRMQRENQIVVRNSRDAGAVAATSARKRINQGGGGGGRFLGGEEALQLAVSSARPGSWRLRMGLLGSQQPSTTTPRPAARGATQHHRATGAIAPSPPLATRARREARPPASSSSRATPQRQANDEPQPFVTHVRSPQVPETVVFERNFPQGWFYFDPRDGGELIKRPGKHLDMTSILQHFSQCLPGSEGVCAQWLMSATEEEAAKLHQAELRSDLISETGGNRALRDASRLFGSEVGVADIRTTSLLSLSKARQSRRPSSRANVGREGPPVVAAASTRHLVTAKSSTGSVGAESARRTGDEDHTLAITEVVSSASSESNFKEDSNDDGSATLRAAHGIPSPQHAQPASSAASFTRPQQASSFRLLQRLLSQSSGAASSTMRVIDAADPPSSRGSSRQQQNGRGGSPDDNGSRDDMSDDFVLGARRQKKDIIIHRNQSRKWSHKRRSPSPPTNHSLRTRLCTLYLTPNDLEDFLFSRGRFAALTSKTGILQRFVPPRSGGRNDVIQVVWSSKMAHVERCVSRAPFQTSNRRVTPFARSAAFDGHPHLTERAEVTASMERDALQLIDNLRAFLFKSEGKTVSRMVAYLKQDASGRLWLMYCTSLRLISNMAELNADYVIPLDLSAATAWPPERFDLSIIDAANRRETTVRKIGLSLIPSEDPGDFRHRTHHHDRAEGGDEFHRGGIPYPIGGSAAAGDPHYHPPLGRRPPTLLASAAAFYAGSPSRRDLSPPTTYTSASPVHRALLSSSSPSVAQLAGGPPLSQSGKGVQPAPPPEWAFSSPRGTLRRASSPPLHTAVDDAMSRRSPSGGTAVVFLLGGHVADQAVISAAVPQEGDEAARTELDPRGPTPLLDTDSPAATRLTPWKASDSDAPLVRLLEQRVLAGLATRRGRNDLLADLEAAAGNGTLNGDDHMGVQVVTTRSPPPAQFSMNDSEASSAAALSNQPVVAAAADTTAPTPPHCPPTPPLMSSTSMFRGGGRPVVDAAADIGRGGLSPAAARARAADTVYRLYSELMF